MNPKLLFWIPAILRLLLVIAAGVFVAWISSPLEGVAVVALILCAFLLTQLYYLNALGNWLDDPASTRLPDGWGAWTGVFARLYRLRREDERAGVVHVHFPRLGFRIEAV